MRLLTDYDQWYDCIFDGAEPVFERMAFTRGGLGKAAQFDLMKSIGLRTPPHGRVEDLASGVLEMPGVGSGPRQILDDIQCIVYLDELAHRGQGKERLTLREAWERYPRHFASMYVAPPGGPVAYRWVRFGRCEYWLRQTGGSGDWRSNRNDEETAVGHAWRPETMPIPRVVWAMDFVPSAEGLLAVDFNTAPQLAVLGEQGLLTAEQARIELEWAVAHHPESMKQY